MPLAAVAEVIVSLFTTCFAKHLSLGIRSPLIIRQSVEVEKMFSAVTLAPDHGFTRLTLQVSPTVCMGFSWYSVFYCSLKNKNVC